MAALRRSLTQVLVIALAAPTLLASGEAFAQAYGPYSGPPPGAGAPAPRPQHYWREGYCAERESVRAPDIMTYDRSTGSEVMVGDGPHATTSVAGINRETGTTFAVHGDLTGPTTTSFCTANGETGSAYTITAERGATVVKGQDGQTGRRFEVAQGPDGHGPDFKSADPRTGRSTEVITPPDGHPIVREFGPHALECTRARLGLGGGAHAEVGDVRVGGDASAHVEVHLGDC
jgi:hypothetical protein